MTAPSPPQNPLCAESCNRILLIACVACVAIGIFFRFYALDRKGFWQDEAWTAAHVTGHRMTTIGARLLEDPAGVNAAQVQAFQHFDRQSGALRTVRLLIETDPQHTPLFSVMEYVWARCFGDSVASMRALAAVFGVLAIPFFYWTCFALFGTRTAAAVGTALFAVSPFQILYSQEAREYSLFTLTTLISIVALFAALREPSRKGRWAIYACTVALGLWSYLLFALSLAVHLALVIAERRDRDRDKWRRMLTRFILADAIGIAAYLPWAAIILLRRGVMHDTTAWLNEDLPSASVLVTRWTRGFASNFVDFHQLLPTSSDGLWWESAIVIAAVVAVLVAVSRTARDARQRTFVLTLAIVPFVVLAFPDLLLGGRRSAQPRYMIVSYLGVSLAVTLLLSRGLMSLRRPVRGVAAAAFMVLIAAGVASVTFSSAAESWWMKHAGLPMISVARAVNASDRPTLVIAEANDRNGGNMIALSRYLHPDVRLRLIPAEKLRDSCRGSLADRQNVYLVESTPANAASLSGSELSIVELPDSEGIAWRIELPAARASTTQGRP